MTTGGCSETSTDSRGLPARRSRAQAVRDVLGREPTRDEAFAVLPRSEWQLALDH